MITIQELKKLVKHELDWLKYYGLRETRQKLTVDSEICDEIVSIGYTKRVIPLDQRCAAGIITSDEKIAPGIDIGKLENVYFPHDRENNRYTPLEAYMVIFPDDKERLIEYLKTKQQRFKL